METYNERTIQRKNKTINIFKQIFKNYKKNRKKLVLLDKKQEIRPNKTQASQLLTKYLQENNKRQKGIKKQNTSKLMKEPIIKDSHYFSTLSRENLNNHQDIIRGQFKEFYTMKHPLFISLNRQKYQTLRNYQSSVKLTNFNRQEQNKLNKLINFKRTNIDDINIQKQINTKLIKLNIKKNNNEILIKKQDNQKQNKKQFNQFKLNLTSQLNLINKINHINNQYYQLY